MTDFFPGSRQRVPTVSQAFDPLAGLSGKMYPVGNSEVELFTIGQVAEALNRRPVAIRKWESEGVIPKATYVKPGDKGDVRGRRRLYSRAQVLALVRCAQEEGILTDKNRQISRTQFKAKVLAAFKEIAKQ